MVRKILLVWSWIIFSSLPFLVLAQTAQLLPEPTTIYTCGENFQPSDLAFDKDGVLYVVNAPQNAPQRDTLPILYSFTNSTCVSVPLDSDANLNTITTNPEGEICVPYRAVNHSGVREQLGCWNGKKWHHRNIFDNFTFSSGLSFFSQDMWLAHSRFYDYPSSGPESGGISYFKNGKLVGTWWRTSDITIRQPSFVVATLNKAIFTEVNYSVKDDFSMVRLNGSVVEIDSEGANRVLNDDFEAPTGIALIEESLWVVDYERGVLYRLDMNGKVTATYAGLQGPTGIKQAPNGDLCIAEMRGARISCYSLTSLGIK
jgi:hypothetical protein